MQNKNGETEMENTTDTKTMTLNDYANERSYVVLFWAGVGTPAGEETPIGHPDLDFVDRRGLLDLNGTVDDEGDWRWDGKGDPTDDRRNTITKLLAYVDANRWAKIVEEYESGN